MVDNTPTIVNQNTDVPDYIDMDKVRAATTKREKRHAAAETYYSNMFALMKLRQKEASGVSKLFRGVFRNILEYQAPTMIKWTTGRYTKHRKYPINYTWPE